jgi:membrane fusion protein (multidrug efflux system)
MADAAPRRSSLRASLIAAATALVAAGALLFGLAPEPERVTAAGDGAALRSVATQRVRRLAIRSRVEVSGVLEARRSVQIFAETRGPVIAVGAEELDRVDAGGLLVEIDPLLAEVAVERAEAAIARNTSEVALARSNLERQRSLADRGAASTSEFDDAVNAEKVAAAALRESRAELKRARDDLTKKKIVARFSGVLRSFSVEVGEYVSAGQRLGELLDLSTARVQIGLSDREVVAVRAGHPATVRVEAYAGETFDGEILRVGAAADVVSKKFPVEIELPNPDARLLPGMVATVILDLGEAELRTVIPRDATLDEFGLRFVWVVERDASDGDWVARRRRVAVRPLPFRPGEFEVLSGLAEGEEIAITGMRQLRDGERVRRGAVEPS